VSGLLLDTCAALWLAEGDPMSAPSLLAVDQASRDGKAIYVSPITAWEIGLLAARGRIAMSVPPQTWFERLLAVPGVALADLSVRVLIASSYLPGTPPRDPADRMIAATARENGYKLITRDQLLLDYASQGHIEALAC
jgi:PIN domain nuclease of toxin-antitoxin system